MKLFKGYLPTKNKKCLISWKNNESALLNLDEVKRFDEYAGVLSEETILIDIDNFEQSEILFKIVSDLQLKCVVYETSRGKHFYFKNSGVKTNKTHTKLGIGLEADIKLGIKNSYSILKYSGKKRTVLYEADEVQELPKWLYPVRTDIDFSNLSEGDGRNQSLFNYILTLQRYEFTMNEARECIELINRYVLKESLSDNELDTILRDESFQTLSFYKGNKFLLNEFATFLKNNNHIIKLNGVIHIYKNGCYIPDEKLIEHEMIKIIPDLSQSKRKEVLSYLDVLLIESKVESDSNLIGFKNGAYNITDDSFIEYNPEIIVRNVIPWDYNPDAECELVDSVLNKMACNDDDIFKLLCECIGYCFYRRNELGKSFILLGEGANGKSTFIDMIKTLLSDENISSLDLKELGDRFRTAEINGKLANLGDDIDDDFISNVSLFKKLTTGERIIAERKGKNPFEFNNYAKLVFSANNIPRMRDKTGAVLRRLVIIPFNAKFTKNDPDYRPYIKYDLRETEAVQRLIVLALRGLKRVLENNCFTESEIVQDALNNYEEENNSIIAFVHEFGIDNIINEPTKAIYSKYNEFCIENGLREAYSHHTFSKRINKTYDLQTKLVKNVRIFIEKEV